MTWGATAVGVGVAGVAGSAISAGKAGDAASEATAQQKAMAEKDLAWRQQVFEYEKGLTHPVRQRLLGEYMSGKPLDYASMAAQIKQNYANAARNFESSIYGRGLAGSGLGAAGYMGMQLGRASDLAGAYQRGLQGNRSLGMSLAGMGNTFAAAQGVSGGYGNLANMYGGQVGMYNQAAQQGWANAGAGVQGLMGLMGQNRGYGAVNTPIPTNPYAGFGGGFSGAGDTPALPPTAYTGGALPTGPYTA